MKIHWAESYDPFTLCGEEVVVILEDTEDEVTDMAPYHFVDEPNACKECRRDIPSDWLP
ncbi:hypothetical protein LCGC14_2305780 [marine sediment metagenome]|uniref:Uncharacterized protein n=1 Tax=marine sediment metagenome TaxID=412755 RepID=A0A0F9EZJ0_9ZZZZ